MELGKNREDREGESSSLGEVAIGLELTEEGQQSREGIKTRPSDTERPYPELRNEHPASRKASCGSEGGAQQEATCGEGLRLTQHL